MFFWHPQFSNTWGYCLYFLIRPRSTSLWMMPCHLRFLCEINMSQTRGLHVKQLKLEVPMMGIRAMISLKSQKKPPRVTVDPLRRKQPQRIQRKVHVRGALGTTMKPGWNFWLIWRNPGSPSLKLRRNGTIATRNVNSCQHCRFQNWKEGNLFPNHARPTHGPSFSLNFQIYFGVGSQLEHGPQQLAGECD